MPLSANDPVINADANGGPRQRPVLALMIRICAGAALATMFMLIKLASQRGIDLPQMLFVRQFLTIPVLIGYLALRGQLGVLRTTRIKSHAGRAFSGTLGMVLNFLAPILLPLAVATTFGFTSPMFAVVLSAVVLREKVGPWRWIAAVLGFIGVLIVADPFNASIPILGACVAIGAAFMVALISIQIRDLTRTEDSIAIVIWFAVFASPILFVVSLFYDWDLNLFDWLLLLGMGLTGIVSQVLLTTSLRFGQVSSVIAMDYIMLLWATAYGWWIFGSLPPSSLWIGAPIIILSGGIILWREQVLHKQRNEAIAH